mgnify:CR=1 FL=1
MKRKGVPLCILLALELAKWLALFLIATGALLVWRGLGLL